VSVQRELARNMLVDLAYVGNRADDQLLFANFNRALPNNSAGTIPLQARRPIPELPTSRTRSTAASRAITRFKASSSGARGRV
jgi:hypothetical protein